MKKLAEAQSRIAIPAKTQRNHKRSFFMRILKNFSVGLVLVIKYMESLFKEYLLDPSRKLIELKWKNQRKTAEKFLLTKLYTKFVCKTDAPQSL